MAPQAPLQQSADPNAIIEAEEGRVMKRDPRTSRHWVLGKLLAQCRLVAALEELKKSKGRSQKAQLDLNGLMLVWPLIFAIDSGFDLQRFPSIPYRRPVPRSSSLYILTLIDS